jgi:predicted nucleotidyltransferase
MDKRSVVKHLDPALWRFAARLRDELGAEPVLLFGSHARGAEHQGSDYDLIIVAGRFGTVPRLRRTIGLHDLFYAVGGYAPLDLICLTPEEFAEAERRPTLVAAVLPDAIDLRPQLEGATPRQR